MQPLLGFECAKRLVEVDCRLVPVKDGPLHSTATVLGSHNSESGEELLSYSLPSLRLQNKDVLDVQSRSCQERGVREEEEGKPYRTVSFFRKKDPRISVLTEKMLSNLVFGAYALVKPLFIVGESVDHLQDCRSVFLRRGSNNNRSHVQNADTSWDMARFAIFG